MTCTCDICKREYDTDDWMRLDGEFNIYAVNTVKKYPKKIRLCTDCMLWLYDVIQEEKKVYEV